MLPLVKQGLAGRSFPSRYLDTPDARRTYGDAAVDGLGTRLLQGDPLADEAIAALARLGPGAGVALIERALAAGIAAVPEAPEPLRALFAAVDQVPRWVKRARLDRGGAVVIRAGLASGVVLGMKSLIHGYASPGGNKPLVFSGRLREDAPRRVSETSRFVQAVSRPGGLDRHADGFAITVKVRLMHAKIRRLINQSGRWQTDSWGVPLNQHDMLATIILFSAALVDGLRRLGYHISAQEADDVIHLWRYAGVVIGVDERLLPHTFAEAMAMSELLRATQGPPDDDSRALVQALFDARVGFPTRGPARWVAPRRPALMHAVCRHLIGDDLADELAIPRPPLQSLTHAVRPFAGLIAGISRLPLWRSLAALIGDRYWDAAVAEGLGTATADYHPPRALARG
jgi:mpaB/rubber oxygenase-like protein